MRGGRVAPCHGVARREARPSARIAARRRMLPSCLGCPVFFVHKKPLSWFPCLRDPSSRATRVSRAAACDRLTRDGKENTLGRVAELQTHKELKRTYQHARPRRSAATYSYRGSQPLTRLSHRRQLPPHGGGVLLGQLQQHAPRALERHAHAALVRVRVRVRVGLGLGLG